MLNPLGCIFSSSENASFLQAVVMFHTDELCCLWILEQREQCAVSVWVRAEKMSFPRHVYVASRRSSFVSSHAAWTQVNRKLTLTCLQNKFPQGALDFVSLAAHQTAGFQLWQILDLFCGQKWDTLIMAHIWQVMFRVCSVSCVIRDVMAELNEIVDWMTVSWSSKLFSLGCDFLR